MSQIEWKKTEEEERRLEKYCKKLFEKKRRYDLEVVYHFGYCFEQKIRKELVPSSFPIFEMKVTFAFFQSLGTYSNTKLLLTMLNMFLVPS